jgi:hypothetical protein
MASQRESVRHYGLQRDVNVAFSPLAIKIKVARTPNSLLKKTRWKLDRESHVQI